MWTSTLEYVPKSVPKGRYQTHLSIKLQERKMRQKTLGWIVSGAQRVRLTLKLITEEWLTPSVVSPSVEREPRRTSSTIAVVIVDIIMLLAACVLTCVLV